MIIQFHGLVFLQDENIILNSQGFLYPIILQLTVTIVTGRMWIMYIQYIHVHVYYILDLDTGSAFTLYYVVLIQSIS